MTRALASLASWVARRRRAVVAAWAALVIAGGWFSLHQGDRLSGGGWSIPGSQSQKADAALQQFPRFAGHRFAVLVDATSPAAADAALAHVRASAARFPNLHETGPLQRFRDGSVTSVLVPYLFTGGDEVDFGSTLRNAMVSDSGGAKTRVLGDGAAWSNFQDIAKEQLAKGEATGFPIVLIVLLLAFGTAVAALAPLLLGFAAVFLTGAVVYLLSGVYDMSIYVTNMASMIGIGVAVDYSLFVVSHYRADFARSGDREAALRAALASAGTAVAFSGATVVISLAGLFLAPVTALRSMAIGAIVVVSIAVLATLTLLPALLALAGHRIDRFRVPFSRRADGSADAFWHAWSRRVMRRPLLFFILGAAGLLLVASPLVALRTQTRNLDQLPRSSEVRAATVRAAELAGPGFLGPVQLITDDRDAADAVYTAAKRVPQVARVTPPAASRAGDRFLVQAVPAVDVQNDAGRRVHAQLTMAARAAVEGTGASLVVGGVTAHDEDVDHALSGARWKIIAFVLVASYLILLLLLRSVLLPLKAVVMNLLSVGAAYGVLVMVFQWGWLDWTGYDSPGYLDSLVPVLVLAVTFGLSMDYEVFLLTRIREFYATGIGNEAAVGEGLAASARVITAAALIMVGVFAAFAIFGAASLKETGVGLAVAIFVDATITRLVLVPATMRLLGDWNWWLPRRVERLLDRAHVPATG
jgi:RND superfamily putative drug exporter